MIRAMLLAVVVLWPVACASLGDDQGEWTPVDPATTPAKQAASIRECTVEAHVGIPDGDTTHVAALFRLCMGAKGYIWRE